MMKNRVIVWVLMTAAAALLPAAAPAESLWRDDVSKPMYSDHRGLGVGGILTIVVQENTVANKNKETKTDHSSSMNAAITSFLYPAGATKLMTKNGQLPAMAFNSDNKHDGGGSINDSESIVAHIAVKIVEVLPNQNLMVEGKRETSFSGEKQTILLHGVVRTDDVMSDNTVLSYNVADASIQIIGKGAVSDSQRKGWFNKVWDKVNPF